MLGQIRARLFLPDNSRSGRVVKRARTEKDGRGQRLEPSFLAASSSGDVEEDEVELQFPPDEEEEVVSHEAECLPADHLLVAEESGEDSLQDSDSSSSSSSGSEVDCVAAAAVAKGKAGKVFPEGLFAKYMCRTSKLLHLKPLDVQGDKLRCGRKLSLNFQLISSEHANLLLGCAQCFTE